MAEVLGFCKRDGLQCPFCISVSSHRAPTCPAHESRIQSSEIHEVKMIVYKYTHNEMSRYSSNLALEMLLSPALGNALVGTRVNIEYDGCTEYPKGVYDGTVVEYDVNKREYIIEYDSGCGSERVDVFKLIDIAKPQYKQFVEEYIENFGVDEEK